MNMSEINNLAKGTDINLVNELEKLGLFAEKSYDEGTIKIYTISSFLFKIKASELNGKREDILKLINQKLNDINYQKN